MLNTISKLLIFSSLILLAFSGSAQNWQQVQKVAPPIDPTSLIGGQSDRVGWAVSTDGDIMVAGAPDSDVNGSSSGAAFVYEKVAGTWQYVAELAPAAGGVGDNFGYSLDVSGTRIIVGAPGDSPVATSSGSAYIFDLVAGVWQETARINQSDASSYDQFGYSVSLSGNRVLVSSFDDDDNGFSSGSAYIFELGEGIWSQKAKLLASDGAANDYFGATVSLVDTIAVCSAYLKDGAGSDRGAAYVFYRQNGTWTQQQKLTAPDAANGDQLGISIAVSESIIAIGASFEDDGGNNAGAVYIFERLGPTWTFAIKLMASDAAANDFFGQSLSLQGNDILIGAYANDDLGNASGSAYVFTKSATWVEQQKLLAPDGAAQDFFGYAVGISGDEVIVGARGDDDSGNDSGSIYIFTRSAGVWTFSFKGTANDMIDDPSLDLFGSNVAMSGFNALIGSYGDDDNGVSSGSARFFRFDGNSWVDQGKFYSSDIAQEDFFGFRVAVSGNTALISSYGDDDAGDFSGSVYVFERIGGVWTQVQKLVASDAATFDDFGFSLAIDGDYAVISSYLDDDFGNFSGSAYVFKRTAGVWTETQKLLPNAGAANQQFGFAVDIEGSQIIIGSRNDGTSVSFGGAAYIYERTGGTWAQTAKIKPSDNTANKVFGSAVSISQGIVLVGALGDNAGASSSGAAYVFEKVGVNWTQKAKLKTDTIVANEYFGYSVDNIGKKLIIGAYRGKNATFSANGSAFIFDGTSGSYVQTQKLTATDGALNDYFGIHVAMSGKNAIIGAQYNDQFGENSGAAYFFADCTDLNANGICDFAESSITNNECENATEITPSVFGQSNYYDQSLFGATESLVGCAGVADDDVWFKFTAQSAHDVILATDPSAAYNTVIEVFNTCESPSLFCSNAYGVGAIERAMPGNLVKGQVYYYRAYDAGIATDLNAGIRTQVKTFENAELRAPFCAATNMQLGESIYSERNDLGEIYSNPLVGVNGYSFRFQEQGGGLNVTVQRPTIDGFYLQLLNVPGLDYGKTYDVSISHRVGIPSNGTLTYEWSDFGTVCALSMLPQIPVTEIKPLQCTGAFDFFLDDQLQAALVYGADRYRFTFTGMGGSDNGSVYSKESTNYAVFLVSVGNPGNGLKYGNTYAVTVQSRVNGNWSLSGSTCTINMAVQPISTAVRAQYCNGTYLFPQSNFILAETVVGATYYQWRFTPMLGGMAQNQITNGLQLSFHQTSMMLMSGVTYDVVVRAFAGGVLGDYGSSCPLTIQANPEVQGPAESNTAKSLTSNVDFKLYPNPVTGNEFILENLSVHELGVLNLEIRDITGRIVQTERRALKGTGTSLRVNLDSELQSGVYHLFIYSDAAPQQMSFIKQ